MKHKIVLLLLMLTSLTSTLAQTTTYYGAQTGTSSFDNSFFGYRSGASITTGLGNSFYGAKSGASTTLGHFNTAVGSEAFWGNLDGDFNTAVGFRSLKENNSGEQNAAFGAYALQDNSTGSDNTAVGYSAMLRNSTGYGNTASGALCLFRNTTGDYNTGSGWMALHANTTGSKNTASGYRSMELNVIGIYNSAFGQTALALNQTGSYNSAFGASAGPNSPDFSNTTSLGFNATPTASNQVRIGNTSVTSIGGQVSWSTLSDGRFKREIKEDVSGLEFINRLRPVSYLIDHYAVDKFLRVPDSLIQQTTALRKTAIRQNGFIAQEVEAVIKKTGYVFHGVEAPQNDGDHYSIRYAEFVVPLVKAVQELTAQGEAQQNEIEALKQQLSRFGDVPHDEHSKSAVLFQNNPNPFSGRTEIRVSLPETAVLASIIVYNLEGKQLKVMPIHSRGNTSAAIQGNELSAGMYIYTLIVDNKVIDTKRMILTGY